MNDEWEALFRLWHVRAHDGEEIMVDLQRLERRIVKLEAFMSATRSTQADRHKYQLRSREIEDKPPFGHENWPDP